MYNLLDYSDNYSKASGNLWECYSDKSNNEANNDIEIAAPLKYLSNFGELLKCQ